MRGTLRPTSDLDILAVVGRATTADERRAIVQRLLQVSGNAAAGGPARPVELTIVRQSEVRPWRPGPVVDLVYGEWLRPAFEKGEIPEPRSMPDLAPEIALALAGDRVIFGPPPAEVLDPVPRDDLRRSVVAGVPSLLSDLAGDQRNVLLTLARIVATLETDEILPKDEAAELIAHRLPPGPLRDIVLVARQMYLDGVSDEQAGADWKNLQPVALEAATALVSEIASFDIG